MIKTINIGREKLTNNLILAPMAGVTDLPFRLLCKEQGAGLLCTEMISAKSIYYKNKSVAQLMETDSREHPVSLQLFGSDPDIISEMAKQIEEQPFEILDLNMGCPVPKIVNNNEGSALMKDPQLVQRIVTKTVRAIQKPVTIKIRKGFNDSLVNAVEIAKIVEDCGAAAITIHGRTREQLYSGKADWDIIRQVKAAVSIPVIGNGDLTCGKDVHRMAVETGCDGFMIGRAAQGNPWIFHQIHEYFKTGREPEKPSWTQVVAMILRHTQLLAAMKGEYLGIREMRKHASWYTGGYKNSAKVRGRIHQVESIAQLKALFEELIAYNE
jgi:nifR3 family TIM-barrel protein